MDINNTEKLAIYPSNCLALTIKNNYKLTIGKNVIREGSKFSLRIFFIIIGLNILNIIVK